MKPSSQTPVETKTVEELAIELLTTGKSMTHGEADARRLLSELRKVWLHDAAREVLESSHGEPMRDAYNAKMQDYSLITRLAGDVKEVRPPSRFHATPAEIADFLGRHFAEDVHLNYQQAIGEEAVREATDELRTYRNHPDAELMKQAWRTGVDDAIDQIDPDRAGPFPSELIRFGEQGGAR